MCIHALTKFAIVTVVAVGLAQPAWGQLSGGIGSTVRSATQANTQQRIQTQNQQRIQAQVRAQAQQRVQAEAMRAARIAQQTAALTAQQARAARRRTAGGVSARIAANVSLRNQARINRNSSQASANADLGVQANLALPPGVTKADVEIYDKIFGRFNPLRNPQCEEPSRNGRASFSGELQRSDGTGDSDSPRNRRRSNSRVAAGAKIDFLTQVNVAARLRRSEISTMRDSALALADTNLLFKAQRMEYALNAFVEAQTKARKVGRADEKNGDDAKPPRKFTGQTNAGAIIQSGGTPGPRPNLNAGGRLNTNAKSSLDR